MSNESSRFYEFGSFRLDTAESCLVRRDQVVLLTPKLFALLMVFVQSNGRTLSKEELARGVWPDSIVSDAALAKNVSRLKRVLNDGEEGHPYIETLSGRGYRFVAAVKIVGEEADQNRSEPTSSEIGGISTSRLRAKSSAAGDHFKHPLTASLLYAALYAVALLVEVAYEWDRYARLASILAAGIFCWMLLTSLSALIADRKWTLRRGAWGLALSALIFAVASALLYLGVRKFLPAHPITQASFQTYTAQAAYLKEIVYFLVLAAFFVIGPFHFILTMERELLSGHHGHVLESLTSSRVTIAPKAKLYLGVLALLIGVFIIRTSFDHAHLLDNLTPSPYKNLFIQLVYLRLALAFALAVECLIWFYRSLNNLKLQCVARAGSVS